MSSETVPFYAQANIPPPAASHQPQEQTGLLEMLEREAVRFPAFAIDGAGKLLREDHRDRVIRRAFLAAASHAPGLALRYLEQVAGRPWIGEVPVSDAAGLARAAGPELREPARKLLIAAVIRNPSLGVREFQQYIGLPFGQEVFDSAALAAPGESVSLASGRSVLAAALREAMQASRRGEVRSLLAVANHPGLDAPTRARVASLAGPIARGSWKVEEAARLAGSPRRYFAALVDERLAASGDLRRGLDRVLEEYALTLCRSFQQSPGRAAQVLGEFAARDLYLLLGYGRAEQEDTFFTGIFDRLLLPKLRKLPGPRPVSRLIEETGGLRFRDFASAAILFHRWEQFAAVEGGDPERAALVARLARGLEASPSPLEDAVTVAEIVELTASPARLRMLAEILAEEHRRVPNDARGQALYGVLAARIGLKLEGGGGELGARYAPYLAGGDAMEVSSLFDASGTSLQRYFFYYDQDGVDSFENFRSAYLADPAWQFEEFDGFVRATGNGGGRRIVIYGNVPFDLLDPSNAGWEEEAARRDLAAGRALRTAGGDPAVIVHRGHSYHVDKTMDNLAGSVALVFLGSCRGLGKIHAVLDAAPEAHVLATRGVGTQAVNDPLLKNLNDELLAGGEQLDWAQFWKRQQARLGRLAHFHDYLPPHRNPAVILLRAYHRARGGSP